MIRSKVLAISLLILLSFTVGCESEEQDLIAQAETCINDNAGDAAGIAECSSYLEGLSSTRIQSLRCSIKLSSSGLDNTRIINALEVMDDDTVDNKEAQFMALVSLDTVANANEAATICSNTDRPDLEYIAEISKIGTFFANELPPSFGAIDETTTFTDQELGDMLIDCEANSTCTEAIGSSAEVIYEIYCVDADISENQVCADVSSAISTVGGYAAIGQALIDLLELD